MNVVCEYCKQAMEEKDFSRFDINFFEKKIHWYCSMCKKLNSLEFSKKDGGPYPRTRIRR
tara:strand:- start:193 stop:372 length:180 start_codon:yes stop_codon:yes gene_type:complete